MNEEKTIAPTLLRDFLVKAQGWTVLEQALRDRLFVLSHEHHPKRQLIYPMNSDAPDYDEAVRRVFDKLAEMTQQTPVSLRVEAHNLRSGGPTYTSTQATTCASCGENRHTPLRIDKMGGYVCLTCIDQKLNSLLNRFGCPEETSAMEPVAWRLKDEESSDILGKTVYVYYGRENFQMDHPHIDKVLSVLEPLFTAPY